jgi:cobalt/nickel transport system permease protein
MHLGNGAITPECAVVTMTAAAAGLAAATFLSRKESLTREKVTLAIGLGALVFAAQAINIPILPGSSAHLVGGVLLAWALGRALGAWTMAAVLLTQSVLLGDGGLLALGANVIKMGLLPAALVAGVRQLGAAKDVRLNAALAALAIPLAAGLIVVETALFRSPAELGSWTTFAGQMLATHFWIGLAEGGLTLALMLAIEQLSLREASRNWRPALATFAAAIVLAVFAFPWSSTLPDGFEASAQASGLSHLLDE